MVLECDGLFFSEGLYFFGVWQRDNECLLEPQQIARLGTEHAFAAREQRNSPRNRIEVGDMGKDIESRNEPRFPGFFPNFLFFPPARQKKSLSVLIPFCSAISPTLGGSTPRTFTLCRASAEEEAARSNLFRQQSRMRPSQISQPDCPPNPSSEF